MNGALMGGDSGWPTVSEMQADCLRKGEASPSCHYCLHFRFREDGPSHMGRCAIRDEPQFEFGVCQSYMWDGFLPIDRLL